MTAVLKKCSRTAKEASPVERPLHRFTVEQYHRMTEIGVLTASDRVELLDGYIVTKKTHNPPHSSTLSRINRLLARLLPDEWVLRVQMPITLRTSESEPDLVIAVGPEETYTTRHPTPRDVALLIEVADSSLLSDRQSKFPLYASERIAECWLVNLVDARIEVYTKPRSSKFQIRRDYRHDDTIPLILRSKRLVDLAVNELLPR